MGPSFLLDSHIACGREFVEELDARAYPYTAVFWLYENEVESWHLFVASPLMLLRGFSGIEGALDAARALPAECRETAQAILVVEPNYDAAHDLQKQVDRGYDVSNRRYSTVRLDRAYIADSYVYKVLSTVEAEKLPVAIPDNGKQQTGRRRRSAARQ